MAYRVLVPLDGTEIERGVTPYLRKIVWRDDAVVTLQTYRALQLPDEGRYQG